MSAVRFFDTTTGEMLPVVKIILSKGAQEFFASLGLSVQHALPLDA